MPNPTIEELRNPEKYELIAQLNHSQIKEFVINQLMQNGKIIKFYMIYQILMIMIGMFFFTRSIVLAFQSSPVQLYYSLVALVFSFSVLVIVHELLHGIALKLTGAKRVTFGGYLKKFIFYAEADRFVINRRQFGFIALTPLVLVKLITLTGIILFSSHPVFYFLIFVMSAHSLFCAGDIGLLSVFYRNRENEIYTFDVKEEKTSYFYRKISSDIS
ncbi:MAG: DUF3267 domain-containing protein [Bacteroidetes bacterium]|nr:MAG: DUF3267 domain-containing protein [Bacteroidota bacterium]